MGIYNIFVICEAHLAFIVECDLVYEGLKGLFLLQNMHLEDVHRERFSKTYFSRPFRTALLFRRHHFFPNVQLLY
jgi:hypothetical protein